jgi:hypothetical protein
MFTGITTHAGSPWNPALSGSHHNRSVMTDSANSSQLSPEDLIEEATGIIIIAFDLDAAQALKVLHRMSQNTGMQMRVVAEQVINRKVPVEALRGVEEDVFDFG